MIKRITLRLSLEKAEDKAIADFLSNIDKSKYQTVNKAIKAILYEAISGTSSVQTEKTSDMKSIVSVIKSTLETEISRLFSIFVSDNKPAKKSVEVVEDDGIDMNYVGI